MSIKERARNAEKKVVSGSKAVGRDVKKGVRAATRKLKGGTETVGRHVERDGSRVEGAGKHGMARVRARLGRKRQVEVDVRTS
jgi:hypothetical protein